MHGLSSCRSSSLGRFVQLEGERMKVGLRSGLQTSITIKYRWPLKVHAHRSLRTISTQPSQMSNVKTPAPAEVQESRHYLRTVLRECTYLPDPQAKEYMQQYAISRFRKYRFNTLNPDSIANARLDEKRKQARKAINFLRRVNNGEKQALLKMLLMTYGRIGARRYALMRPLLPAGQLQRDLARTKSDEQPTSHFPSSSEEDSSSKASQVVNGNSARGDTELENIYREWLHPPLRALLESQTKTRMHHLTRPEIRSLAPNIPKTNSWLRPMPQKRVKNLMIKWYAGLLERVHPPLPTVEWNRLRSLASGRNMPKLPVSRRKFIEPQQEARPKLRPTPLESLVLRGTIDEEYAKVTNPKKITPRAMQRLWAQVFAQCPHMRLDETSKKWEITWGYKVLHLDQLPSIQVTPATDAMTGTSHTVIEGQ